MITLDKQDLMQSQTLRQRKKALKFLRVAFESQKQHQSPIAGQKKHQQLQTLMSSMRINRLRNAFYKKLTLNNIFRQPITFQLLSEQEKNNRRFLKIKGIYLHPHLLSFIFVLEMIFLVITFVISSWMAFLTDFIRTRAHMSTVVVILNVLTFLMSLVKFIIMSMSQKIQKGILISYITDIVVNYARSFMMFADLLFIIVMGVLLVARHTNLQNIEQLSALLFACSIVRIAFSNTNLTLFRTTFMTSTRMDQYYKLFHLIAFNLIFAHFIASMLFAMAKLNNTMNWMVSKNLQHESWYVQYMWGYYWATTTMMTVGFGDFLPVTYQQGFIVAFLQFFSCIVLAYNISQIGGIISSIRSAENEFITKIALFKRMANQNQLDHELKNKIESYLRQEKAIKEKFQFNQQHDLLETLPQPLRKQYVMSSNGRLFKYLPFFRNLQKSTLLKFAETLTSKVYYPSQLLSRANQYNDQIMVLKDGKIGLGYRRIDSKLNGIIVDQIEIKQRDFLTNQGEKIVKNLPVLLTTHFLTPGKIVNYDMIALTYSHVYWLSDQNFLEAIKQSDMDTEYFFSIIHRHSPTGNQWQQLPCENCMSEDLQKKRLNKKDKNNSEKCQNDDQQRLYFHTKFECPRIHYLPLKGVIVYKYLTSQGYIQQRKQMYHRKQRKNKENCLMLRKYAFKTYQKHRMIGQKRRIQKQIEKIALSISIKQKAKKQASQSIAEKYNRRQKSDTIFEIQQNSFDFQTQRKLLSSDREKSSKQGNKRNKILKQPLISQQLSFQQANSSIMTQDQYCSIGDPFNSYKLAFWDVQIDLMSNYFNYFPQQNGSNLDNIELCQDKESRNKALCLIGELMKLKSLKNISQLHGSNKKIDKKQNVMQNFLQIFMKMQSKPQQQQDLFNIESQQQRLKKSISFSNSKKGLQRTQSQIISQQKHKYQQRYSNLEHYFPKPQRTTQGSTVRENVRMEFSAGIQDDQNDLMKFRNESLPVVGLQSSRKKLTQGGMREEKKILNQPSTLQTYKIRHFPRSSLSNSQSQPHPFFE